MGDGTEEEVLRSEIAGNADGEGARRVTVDAIGTATSLARDGAGWGWLGVCGCKAEGGGEADKERAVMHCNDQVYGWGIVKRRTSRG